MDISNAFSTSSLDKAALREKKTLAAGKYNLAAGVGDFIANVINSFGMT
jgi:hypothetical protein